MSINGHSRLTFFVLSLCIGASGFLCGATIPPPPGHAGGVFSVSTSFICEGVASQQVAPSSSGSRDDVERWANEQIEKVKSDPRASPEHVKLVTEQALKAIDIALEGRTIFTTFTLSVAPDGFMWRYSNSDQPENTVICLMSPMYSDYAIIPPSGNYTIIRENRKPLEAWHSVPGFFSPAQVAEYYEKAEWEEVEGSYLLTLKAPSSEDFKQYEFPHGMRIVYDYANGLKLKTIKVDDGKNGSDGVLLSINPTSRLISETFPSSFKLTNLVKGKPGDETRIEIHSWKTSAVNSVKEWIPWQPGDTINDKRFNEETGYTYRYDPSQSLEDIDAKGKMHFQVKSEQEKSVAKPSFFNRFQINHIIYALGIGLIAIGFLIKWRNRA